MDTLTISTTTKMVASDARMDSKYEQSGIVGYNAPSVLDDQLDVSKLNPQDVAITENSSMLDVIFNSQVKHSRAYSPVEYVSQSSNVTFNLMNDTRFLNGTQWEEEKSWLRSELQLIKVIVLIVVITILLLSTCKLVLKTFSKYAGGVGRRDEEV
jgi:hypothetical protein